MAIMSGLRATFVKSIAAIVLAVPFNLMCRNFSLAAEPTMTIGCHIRVTPQNDMLRLEAMANGRATANGSYRFEIFKQSSTGTSQNVQSGAFHLDAGRDEVLTTIVLDGSALGHYRARLVLETQEFGSVSCVSP
jgi:curli production assembly/transport CsgH protein